MSNQSADFIQKFLAKNLKALPSQHHKSIIVEPFFISKFSIIFRCLSNDGTKGAFFFGKNKRFIVLIR
jgi:hypothetical protein